MVYLIIKSSPNIWVTFIYLLENWNPIFKSYMKNLDCIIYVCTAYARISYQNRGSNILKQVINWDCYSLANRITNTDYSLMQRVILNIHQLGHNYYSKEPTCRLRAYPQQFECRSYYLYLRILFPKLIPIWTMCCLH